MKQILPHALLGLVLLASPLHAASTPKLRVAYTSVTGNRAPFWIAKEAGLFQKHGLEVELIYLQSVAVGLPALIGGDFQILAGGVAAYLSAFSRGAKLILFGTFGPTPYILFTRPEIQDVTQLKGAIIGVNRLGASDYYALRRLLQKLELSPDRDVKIISAGAPLDRLISVEKGTIQGTLGTDMGLATNPVKVRRLVDLTQMGVEDHGSALATTASFARSQPEIMDRFVRAFVEAIALGRKDRSLAKKVYAKYLRLTDDNLLELNYKVYLLGSIPKVPFFPLEALKNVLTDLAEENPKAREINVEEVLDNSFIQRQVDNGFIDRLYR
ncbi:MAG TPA: ABC transporter substrate-binding protein [Candidatus Binatia bacterium]|jgi:ABC-type nitrate/sulfonate/bicarbonate transport system substrate-binding protein